MNIDIETIHELLKKEVEKFQRLKKDEVAYGITHARIILQKYVDDLKKETNK